MKKVINLSLLLLVLLLPVTALAHDFEVDGIYYNINGNNATVTYQGTSFWQYNDEYSGDITIPETVTYNGTTYSVITIGQSAFRDCSGLTSVTIPNSVTNISNAVFWGSSGLTSVTVESGNPKYDSRNNCNAIIETAKNKLIAGCKNSTIPNSASSIGEYAFYGCSGLTSVTIPNSVTSIGEAAFSGCNGLTSVTVGNSVNSIGGGAFDDTAWYNNQPGGLVYAGLVAYKYKGTMPAGTSIILADGTLGIAEYAFSSCSGLTSITIPNPVTNIGYSAFSGCSGLTSVNISDIEAWCKISFYNGSANPLSYGHRLFLNGEEVTDLFIPNSVTDIGYCAFYGCSGLVSVTIPNSVTIIDDYSFYNCSGLTSVTIGNSVTTIGYSAFSDCSGLNDVFSFIEDPTTVSMGSSVFYRYPANYAERTLHVPVGSVSAYQANTKWSQYFGSIVEMENEVTTPGDVNGDGELGIADVTALINYLLTGDTTGISPDGLDCNQDGEVGIADVADLINFLLTGNW